MAYIPFLRVSTKSQETARQLTQIQKYASEQGIELSEPISETISGAKRNDVRPAIQAVLKGARRGDVVITTEISRIGRNAAQAMTLLEELSERGVAVRVLDLGLTTLRSDGSRDMMAWAMLAVGVIFAQLERGHLRDRVNSGLSHARKEGRIGGRPTTAVKTDAMLLEEYAHVVKMLKAKKPIREIAVLANLSTRTVQKVRNTLFAKPENSPET